MSETSEPGRASKTLDEADAPAWHKRFAARSNNRAWELASRDRTPAEDRELLDLAHASAWHWAQVGTELNRMRATLLLAAVHAELGMGASALALAREMHGYFAARATDDWELAMMHAIDAHAAHAAGLVAEHRQAYQRAAAALAAIADDEDRAVVALTFDRVPTP
jgi:hypothetical protein